MKYACESPKYGWCGELHDKKPSARDSHTAPDGTEYMPAWVHTVTDDAIGPRPWETHLYQSPRGGPRPGSGPKPKPLEELSPRTKMVSTKIHPDCAEAIRQSPRSLAEVIEEGARHLGIWNS